MFDVTAGVSKQMFEKRGNLKLSLSDIFFQNGWGGGSKYGELYMRGGGTWESRQVRVNFSYSFGNNQVKGSRNRNTGLEEESKRAGGSQVNCDALKIVANCFIRPISYLIILSRTNSRLHSLSL